MTRTDDEGNPVAGIALGVVLGIAGWVVLIAGFWYVGRLAGMW